MADNGDKQQEMSEDDIDALLAVATSENAAQANAEDDDLLADFEDVLGGAVEGAADEDSAPAIGEAPDADPLEDEHDLAELDAFLDEFEQSLDSAEGAEAADATPADEPLEADAITADDLAEDEPLDDALPDEEPPAGEAGDAADEPDEDLIMDVMPGDEPLEASGEAAAFDEPPLLEPEEMADDALTEEFATLDAEDLNLALADDDEPLSGGHEEIDEPETAEMGDLFDTPPEPEDEPVANLELPEPEPMLEGTEKAFAAAPAAQPAAGGRPMGVALAAVVLALLAGAGTTWLSLGVKGQVQQLYAAVERLKSRPVAGADTAQVEKLAGEVGRINQRVNELAVLMDGPMSHVGESNRRELDSIAQRLDHNDKQIAAIEAEVMQLAARKPEPAPVRAAVEPARKPAPRAAAPVRAKASPKVPEATAKGVTWVANLVSLSDAGTARHELRLLRQKGINAKLQEATVKGKLWYRLRVDGFSSREAAERFADGLKGKMHIGIDPWFDHD